MKLSQLYDKAETHFQPNVKYSREQILAFLMPERKVKRAMSPYQLFLADKTIQEKIKSTHPTATFGEKSKLLAEMWGKMPESEKTPYIQQAEQIAPPKKKKRAPTAYNLFIKDPARRQKLTESHPDTPQKDIMRLLAAEWKTLSDEQKKTYQDQSDKLKISLETRTESSLETSD